MGLSRAWAERLSTCEEAQRLSKRQVLAVHRLLPGTPLHGTLQEGDLLLAVDGTPVNTFTAVEAATMRRPSVALTVLREKAERQLQVRCSPMESDGTRHIAMWCGLILQQCYRAVLERGFAPEGGGVYISYYLFGSPAHKYKLVPKHWVTEINGEPVGDLCGFLAIVRAAARLARHRHHACPRAMPIHHTTDPSAGRRRCAPSRTAPTCA